MPAEALATLETAHDSISGDAEMSNLQAMNRRLKNRALAGRKCDAQSGGAAAEGRE